MYCCRHSPDSPQCCWQGCWVIVVLVIASKLSSVAFVVCCGVQWWLGSAGQSGCGSGTWVVHAALCGGLLRAWLDSKKRTCGESNCESQPFQKGNVTLSQYTTWLLYPSSAALYVYIYETWVYLPRYHHFACDLVISFLVLPHRPLLPPCLPLTHSSATNACSAKLLHPPCVPTFAWDSRYLRVRGQPQRQSSWWVNDVGLQRGKQLGTMVTMRTRHKNNNLSYNHNNHDSTAERANAATPWAMTVMRR